MYINEIIFIEKLKPEYNLHEGGKGGWNYVNKNITKEKKQIDKARMILVNKIKNDPDYRKKYLEKLRKRDFSKISESLKKKYKLNPESHKWLGRKHSTDTIEKMKISHIGKHEGHKNSQFGTIWITNEIENKKLKKEEMIPKGWRKGRKIL